jgi:UDPglucose 6-dehydrogenase
VSGSFERVSVVGLGKLGAPLAAVLASRGLTVVGVDAQPEVVRRMAEGESPVFEPGLAQMLQEARGRITATADVAEAVAATDVTFILVPTPSEDDGAFSLRYVRPVAEQVGRALRAKAGFHVVVLTSTVMPGATASTIAPILERESGKRCGVDFGLCYNPEFVALGNVIRGILNPDFVLIGESDPTSGDTLASLYRRVCQNDPPIVRMNFVNAEVTKLAVNTFVTTKISYANMLAQICQRLPGADSDVVTSALGLDNRIGRSYLKGAVSYGGPCFPRDNLAFVELARQVGAGAQLAEATDGLNRQHNAGLAAFVRSKTPPGGCVGILGLSYKPNTDVVDESPGLDLARRLIGDGVEVVAYDPAAMENARRALGGALTCASSARECARRADVLVVITPWEEFKQLSADDLSDERGRPIVVDCWRLFNASDLAGRAEYVALGIGPAVGARSETENT